MPAPEEQVDARAPVPDFGNPERPAPTPEVGVGASGSSAPPPIEGDASAPLPMVDARTEDPPTFLDAAAMHDAASPLRDASAPMEPDPPAPGTAFSACTQTLDCMSGLVCTTATMWTTPGARGYCTAFCGTGGVAGDACPQPTSGIVRASCQLATFLCELESCERSQCPSWMQCVDAELPIGGGQVTTVFTCQP